MEKISKDFFLSNKHYGEKLNQFDLKLADDFLQRLEDSSDSEDEYDQTDINKMKDPRNYIDITYWPDYIEYIIKKINIKRLISFKQNILDPTVTSYAISNAKRIFNYPTFNQTSNSEDVHFKKISQDYSYSDCFNGDKIAQLLPLACAKGYYELVQIKIERERKFASGSLNSLLKLLRLLDEPNEPDELIEMNIDVDKPTIKEKCTALMEAAKAGHADIVCLLLSHGANVNAHSATKNSPLIYACAGGHKEVVRVLLEAGATAEHHNEDGCTPLKAAAKAGHLTIAKMLLKHGAKYNTHSKQFKVSALILACYKGHLAMVRLLLKAGKNETKTLRLALMAASMEGHIAIAYLLIYTGAPVHSNKQLRTSSESPLLLAAWRGHSELVKLLLHHGADINEVNSMDYNPLMQAAREGHIEIVVLLLNRDNVDTINVDKSRKGTEETALTLACSGGFLEVVRYLVQANADVDNYTDEGSLTPLMMAVKRGHVEIVEYLLECAAIVNAQTSTGETALMYASENGHIAIINLLLQFGAQLDQNSEEGVTPLMKACVTGHFDTVQHLVSKGANVNCQTQLGQTPLTLAIAAGHIAIVALLLDHGANREYKSENGCNVIMEAIVPNEPFIINLLRKPQIFRSYQYKYDKDNEFIFGNYFSAWEKMINEKPERDRMMYMICKMGYKLTREKDNETKTKKTKFEFNEFFKTLYEAQYEVNNDSLISSETSLVKIPKNIKIKIEEEEVYTKEQRKCPIDVTRQNETTVDPFNLMLI